MPIRHSARYPDLNSCRLSRDHKLLASKCRFGCLPADNGFTCSDAVSAPTVLHYLGYDTDRGGIVSVVRALEKEKRFSCILGVNPGFQQLRSPPLPTLAFAPLAGETINLRGLWRARQVAREAARWLAEDDLRIFHGHSRAGLLVAWWLVRRGETRAVASVHCYGRQRGFYRWASRALGARLYWLTPTMRRYYGLPGRSWDQCIPACVATLNTSGTTTPKQTGVCVLGGIGTVVEWKGWHLILSALAELPKDVRERFRFRHIGGPEGSVESRSYAARLQAQTTAVGLDSIVEWRGPQDSPEPLLAEIDVLVVASRSEPCSVAMLEALQRGVPVLAADSGGALDVIRPPANGWLFRTGNVTSLAHALGRLADPMVRAKAVVDYPELERFFAPRVAAQWEEVYRALRGNPHGEIRR